MSNRRNDHGTSPGSHRLFFISFLAYHLLLRSKQCIAVHIYYLASNAYLYDLVLGKQGLHIQVLQIGKQGPDSCLLLCKQCTDPDLRQFLHRLVGNTSQTQRSHFM